MDKINELNIEDISIGDVEKFSITVTEQMVDDFAKISGDYNPIHMNEEYAKQTKFSNRICHGMLISSFFSRLIGMYLPGKNSLYFSQNLNFVNPCYINDIITVEGEVIDKSESIKMIKIRTRVKKQDKIIIDGIAQVMIR